MSSDSRPLDGKAALVTGASAGIGRETAVVLAEAGADVALAARRDDRLRSVAEEIESAHPVGAHVVPTDVTDEEQVEAMVDSTVDRFGGLDVVVSNAGTGTAEGVGIEELDTEQYRTVMAVNTDGMFYTARAALPHLRASAGTIVFVGSFSGKYPRPSVPVYAATKWWTRGFALSLAGQAGADGVAVTLVSPSAVRTEWAKEFRPPEDRFTGQYDPGEVLEPREVAEAVSYAAEAEPPNAVTEVDLYARDKFAGF